MRAARRKLTLRSAVHLATILCATLCNPALNAETIEFGGPTMGTTFRVKVVDAAPDTQASIKADVEGILADVDRRLSTYRSDSEVSRFNRAAKEDWIPVSPETAETVLAALQVSQLSGGAVDVTVGPLVRIWHFGPHAVASVAATREIAPPDASLLQQTLHQVGYRNLEVRSDPPALRKHSDGLEIELSCIGEGDAIDRIARALANRGLQNFLVELGGEVRAQGTSGEGRPWLVAVQRPTVNDPQIEQKLALQNAAISTSGNYRRFFDHDGKHYSHIIDPSTGRPITHSLVSVTVVANECRTADVWATALLVLGPEKGLALAEERGIKALFITRESGSLRTFGSRDWETHFDIASTPSAGPDSSQKSKSTTP